MFVDTKSIRFGWFERASIPLTPLSFDWFMHSQLQILHFVGFTPSLAAKMLSFWAELSEKKEVASIMHSRLIIKVTWESGDNYESMFDK